MQALTARGSWGGVGWVGVSAGCIHSTKSPSSPTSPSLISLMVSVDVKHHVYLLTEI